MAVLSFQKERTAMSGNQDDLFPHNETTSERDDVDHLRVHVGAPQQPPEAASGGHGAGRPPFPNDNILSVAKDLVLHVEKTTTLAKVRLGVVFFDLLYGWDIDELRSQDPDKDVSLNRLGEDPEVAASGFTASTIKAAIRAGVLHAHLCRINSTLYSPDAPPLRSITAMSLIVSGRPQSEWEEWVEKVRRGGGRELPVDSLKKLLGKARSSRGATTTVASHPSAACDPGGWTTHRLTIDGHDVFVAVHPLHKPVVLANCPAGDGLDYLHANGIKAGHAQGDPIYAGEYNARMFGTTAAAVWDNLQRDIAKAVRVLDDGRMISVFQEKNTDHAVRAYFASMNGMSAPQVVYLENNMTRKSVSSNSVPGHFSSFLRGDDTLVYAAKNGPLRIPALDSAWVKANLPNLNVKIGGKGMMRSVVRVNLSRMRTFPYDHPCPKNPQVVALDFLVGNPGDLPYVEFYAGMASGAVVAIQWGFAYIGFESDAETFHAACQRIEHLVAELNGVPSPYPGWSDLLRGRPETEATGMPTARRLLGERVDELRSPVACGPIEVIDGALTIEEWEDMTPGGVAAVAAEFRAFMRRHPHYISDRLIPLLALQDDDMTATDRDLDPWHPLRATHDDFVLYMMGEADERHLDGALAAAGTTFVDHLRWFLASAEDLYTERSLAAAGAEDALP
ncbi:MAG: hypothetical protein IT350_00835 [Deltaproteobacteria bacterium]|nr:hypothetical protein [Deltaproteobacteria bacterium]